MICHVVDQVERTVEMRSWGGREGPHKNLEMVVNILGLGFCGGGVGRLRETIGWW